MRVKLLVLLVIFVSSSLCANILFIGIIPAISHQTVVRPLIAELSLKGHNVTLITTDPVWNKTLVNLTEIDVSEAYKIFTPGEVSSLIKHVSPKETAQFFHTLLLNVVSLELQNPRVQNLIQDDSYSFDVVVSEVHNPAMFAFSERFKCPLVTYSTLGGLDNAFEGIGNPTHPLVPTDILFEKSYKLNFVERVESLYFYVWYQFYYRYYYLPRLDKVVKEYFGLGTPYIGDIEKNVSLFLMNVNPIIHMPRATVPGIVQLGPLHIKSKHMHQHLTQDLQKYLDDAVEGVIYFSLGSTVKTMTLPQDTKDIFNDDLGKLPYKVIWKYEDDSLKNLSSNVILRKWLPQRAILNHPNVKVFVTQGGLHSLEEAIIHGVPIVGIPLIGDQGSNIHRMVDLGTGISLSVHSLKRGELFNAVLEVATNSKYKDNMKKLSEVLLDKPMSAIDTAIWWIEYVIRHQGARFLHSPVADIPLYQYLLLDIIAILFGLVYVTYLIVRKLPGSLRKEKLKLH